MAVCSGGFMAAGRAHPDGPIWDKQEPTGRISVGKDGGNCVSQQLIINSLHFCKIFSACNGKNVYLCIVVGSDI